MAAVLTPAERLLVGALVSAVLKELRIPSAALNHSPWSVNAKPPVAQQSNDSEAA